MSMSNSPKIYAGMLKRELLEVAGRLGLVGVRKMRKAELLQSIQAAVRRGKDAAQPTGAAIQDLSGEGSRVGMDTVGRDEGASSDPTAVQAAPEGGGGGGAAIPPGGGAAGGGAAGGGAGGGERPPREPLSDQSRVTAVKYGGGVAFPAEELRQVDAHLPQLPDGYGQDRLVLLPRDPNWMYAYWDLQGSSREAAREQGGQNLALRLYEYHDDQLEPMAEHWVQEVSRSWYLPVPSPGQSYLLELGYRKADGGWLPLLTSNRIIVPPAQPSSVIADEFATLWIDEPLPRFETGDGSGWSRAVSADTGRGDGQVHDQAHEASMGPEGVLWPGSQTAIRPGPSGVPTSPHGAQPWAGSPRREQGAEEEQPGRDFWLVADAELVVFGKTEPNAKVKLAGQRIHVRPDGSFSVRMAFPNGTIDIPIEATAADGEQERSLDMHFSRETSPLRSNDG